MLFSLALALRAIIVLPAMQTWLVQRATLYLSDELKTHISIRHVNIEFFKKIVLEEIYVEDLQHDTLLYAPQLKVSLSNFNYKTRKLTINSAELNDARIKLIRYKKIKGLNVDFLVDYFSSTDTDTVTVAVWNVKLKNVKLNNAAFSYRDQRWDDTTTCIDWEDVYATHLNAELTDFTPENDTMTFRIENISLKEKSGFDLKNFSADARTATHYFDFKKLNIATDQSSIHGRISFSFDHWSDFDDYNHKVKMSSSFTQSTLASEDLKYFSSELNGLKKTVSFSGDAKGTVDRLKGKNLNIIYTPQCFFKGDATLTGLPDFNETYMELSVNELWLNKKDIETIPAYPFVSSAKISLPPNIDYLGTVKFKGKFNGFYNDFVAYGNATTDIGFVSSDLNLKIGDGKSPAQYSGHLSTINFDIGKMLRLQPDVGKVSAHVQIKGSGLAVDRINTALDGTISELEVKGYPYHNLEVNGAMAKKLFNGSLIVRDENADFDFNGQVDYRGNLPVLNFVADVHKANLTNLNIIHRDNSASISTHAELRCIGNKLDNLQGSLLFDSTKYIEFPRGITINHLALHAEENQQHKRIRLESDFADASMTGNFKLSQIFSSAAFVLSQYIPAIKVKNSSSLDDQTFDYTIDLKETRGVLDVLMPDLSINAGTHLEGHFSTISNDFTSVLRSDEVIYKGVKFDGVNVTGNTSQGQLYINCKEDHIQIDNDLNLNNVLLSGKANNNAAQFNLLIADQDSALSKLNVDFILNFLNNNAVTMKLVPHEMMLEHNNWKLDSANLLVMDSTGIALKNYVFSSGDQLLNIAGRISRQITDQLNIGFSNFNLAVLNPVLRKYKAELGGIINGSTAVSSLYHKASVEGDLNITNLSFFNDTLGDAKIISNWNTGQGIIDISALVTRGGIENISADGKYIIKEKNDEIDFAIQLKKTNAKTFSNYLTGIASDISGIASGNFHLYGLASAPYLTGTAHLQKINFKIDYLNTSYSFSTDVELMEDYIGFTHVLLNDVKGNKAIANGKIYHKHLHDFYFDVDIAAGKTQVLNTTAADNELFYGVAYASGIVRITGYLDYIKMDIGLKSEKGTEISIPLSNPEEVSHNSYITFINRNAAKDTILGEQVDISGIEMNFDLDITQDAVIRLEFDPKIGDVIKGTGHGNITMNISPTEGFKMFGDYIIDNGQYLFTLQNVISKEFTIENGGYVRWSGDPYDAYVNINANYSNLKASLYDLIPDSTAGYHKLVPVVLKLNISDKLFNPVIKFDIDVKNIDATTESRVKRVINTEEAKYKQAVSLLVIRRFTPADEFLTTGPTVKTSDVVGTNAYEFLSAQLSNWASQINENVNVGVNYQPGSNLTQEQLEVALSTSLFNDRVTIDGNVGVANSNSTTTANQNTTNLAGDFNVEVKANKDGRVRLKAFTRSNNNSLINNLNSQYTQGIGVFYREEFNSWNELMQRIRDRFRKKKVGAETTGSLTK